MRLSLPKADNKYLTSSIILASYPTAPITSAQTKPEWHKWVDYLIHTLSCCFSIKDISKGPFIIYAWGEGGGGAGKKEGGHQKIKKVRGGSLKKIGIERGGCQIFIIINCLLKICQKYLISSYTAYSWTSPFSPLTWMLNLLMFYSNSGYYFSCFPSNRLITKTNSNSASGHLL